MTTILGVATIIAASTAMATTALADDRSTGRGTGPIIYVESQGLYYDSIVLFELPPNGRFQQLIPVGTDLFTKFGPGDVGYLGGRWWVDANKNTVMDDGDAFFMCPLLGPGRTVP